MDDIINILEGKDLEKYVAHIANKGFELKCHIVQSITLAIEKNNSEYFKWLKNASLQSDNKKVAKNNKIKVAEKNASDQVNNAFKFFALINDNRTILGMFYSLLNENSIVILEIFIFHIIISCYQFRHIFFDLLKISCI